MSGPSGADLRFDIQALRALAVALVVVFHLFPEALSGGYVGVDAFFVVSGYLITLHLVREIERTGTLDLPQFWARRARRLLPASLLVLAVTTAAVVAFASMTLWGQFAMEALAATLYVQNWRLAADAVEYSASDNLASPVQHFWSLSVEEQFYLAWPLLLLASVWWARRSGRSFTAVARAMLMGLVSVSAVYAIWVTLDDRRAAYFDTFARASEFGAGALLVFVPLPPVRAPIRRALATFGVLLLLGAALLYGPKTPFPGGFAGLPVLGTVLVLGFGTDSLGPTRSQWWMQPVSWLGDHSYEVYLWHWPLLVLAAERLGPELHPFESLLALAATLLLAFLSKRYVEDPVRFAPLLVGRRARITFACVGAATATLVGSSLVVFEYQEREAERVSAIAERTKSEIVPCFGAIVSARPSTPCPSPVESDEIVPRPIAASRDELPGCTTGSSGAELEVCELGDARGETVVGLLGDSHAAHWLPTLTRMASDEDHDLRILTFLKGACPYSEAERSAVARITESCEKWKDAVEVELDQREEIDVLIISASAILKVVAEPGETSMDAAADGFAAAWEDLPAHIERVVVLRDVPRPRADVVQCVDRALRDDGSLDSEDCALPREDALLPDPQVLAAERSDRVQLVDFSSVFCDAELCHPVVGDALVYRDGNHMTATFARTLAPLLDAQLDRHVPALESL